MIKEEMLYSRDLGLDWSYSIYLPNSTYEAQKLPVIYLLHGAYGHHSDYWRNFDLEGMMQRMMDQGLPAHAIVMPDGFNSYYINGPAYAMEDAIIEDFIPIIEERYGLAKQKEQRIIAGLSMGGYGALRFALRYPRLFSRAYLFSPAIWQEPSTMSSVRSQFHLFGEADQPFSQRIWESYHPLRYLLFYEQEHSPVDFKMITGEQDTITSVEEIMAVMQKLAFYAPVSNRVLADVGHDWVCWQASVQGMLEDLMDHFNT